MDITRRSLFAGATLTVGLFHARPVTDACGDIERQSSSAIVLPLSGVFAKHDAPGRHVIGTPSHAIYFAADAPYRLSFPGAIGDCALTLRPSGPPEFDQLAIRRTSETPASHGLLPPNAMVLRNLLWARLQNAEEDPFENEALALELLGMSLSAIKMISLPERLTTRAQRQRAVERVKEAVGTAPTRKWSIAELAKIANLSPFHLCHIFRRTTGTSIYGYILHERLALTLDAVLEDGEDITGIALDAGFASHSHFTARFRRFFGCTPTALRRMRAAKSTAEIRNIMTAQHRRID